MYRHAVGASTYRFAGLKELLAKASPLRSGDVLAGFIGALAARGAPAGQAAVWNVALHALAGARLVRRFGTLGILARDLPAEVPSLMDALRRRSR